MKKMVMMFLMSAVLMCAIGCTSSAAYQLVRAPEGTRLSTHQTMARFDGFEVHPCLHMTADCPDRCDHGGIYARFTIEEYLGYEKLDRYGDAEQKEFHLRMSSVKDVPDPAVPVALRKVILQLEPGETVALDWAHVYVVYPNGLHTPERIVTRLAQ